MKKSSIRIIVAVCVLAAVMIAGCAAQSKVKMVRESVDWQQERAVLQRSIETFDQGNSTFSLYEWRPGITAAIVADLKDPDRVVKPGPGWRKINSRQELEAAYQGGGAVKTKGGLSCTGFKVMTARSGATSLRLITFCLIRLLTIRRLS